MSMISTLNIQVYGDNKIVFMFCLFCSSNFVKLVILVVPWQFFCLKVQFGHANACANAEGETARAKNKVSIIFALNQGAF